MTFDIKIPPDARTVLPGREVTYVQTEPKAAQLARGFTDVDFVDLVRRNANVIRDILGLTPDRRIGKLARMYDGRVGRVAAVEPDSGALLLREDGWSPTYASYRVAPGDVEWVEEDGSPSSLEFIGEPVNESGRAVAGQSSPPVGPPAAGLYAVQWTFRDQTGIGTARASYAYIASRLDEIRARGEAIGVTYQIVPAAPGDVEKLIDDEVPPSDATAVGFSPVGLPPGLYELHWRVGGSSLAAVGMYSDGRRWFAPTAWAVGVPSVDWGLVKRAVEIRRPEDKP